MSAVAQGMGGVALVMAFALLRTYHSGVATILLAVQSAAAAVAVAAAGRPVMALPPLLVAGMTWLAGRRLPPDTEPASGGEPGLVAGIVLTVLCQASAAPGVPLSVALLAVLLAATRVRPLLRLTALAALQNGIALAAATAAPSLVLPLACLALPVPFALYLVIAWRDLPAPPKPGWIALGLSLCVLAASLTVPLDPLASVFAPLIAFAGVVRARAAYHRGTTSRLATGALQLGFSVTAVCAADPVNAWLAILGAAASALAGAERRIRGTAALAFSAAGIALFGLATPAAPLIATLGVFAGYAILAACVPALGVPLAVMLLRYTGRMPLPGGTGLSPDGTGLLLAGLGSAALLCCAALAARPPARFPGARRHLAHLAIAVLPMGIGADDARFSAIVLLVLLVLTGTAVPPVAGADALLFPGLALVALALAGHDPWLLLPLGAGIVPTLLALGLPRTLPPPASLVPLGAALVFGFLAPGPLLRWLHGIAALRP
jgi:hypothetical protein